MGSHLHFYKNFLVLTKDDSMLCKQCSKTCLGKIAFCENHCNPLVCEAKITRSHVKLVIIMCKETPAIPKFHFSSKNSPHTQKFGPPWIRQWGKCCELKMHFPLYSSVKFHD